MKSAPVLIFGFSKSHIFNISVSEILENSKSLSFLLARKFVKQVSVDGISEASFGPICEKKVLNPLAISR